MAEPVEPQEARVVNMEGYEAAPDLVELDVVQVPKLKLGYFAVICLILNRVVGTGIFNALSTVLAGTGSQGIALVFWAVGGIFTVAASYLYAEFGLNVPRYSVRYPAALHNAHTPVEAEEGVPRSGGELNYLSYVFNRPKRLFKSLFGIGYIFFGNMAANGLAFGQFCFLAGGWSPQDVPAWPVRGIAIAVATFSCLIHGFSPRLGIWLSNLLATVKVLMLLLIIITMLLAATGRLSTYTHVFVQDGVFHASQAFRGSQRVAYGYAEALLAIWFTYDGWNQANYVLSEIRHPRKVFRRSLGIAVTLIVVLYMLVALSYMVVVPTSAIVQTSQKRATIPKTLVCAGNVSTSDIVPIGTTGAVAEVFFDCTYGLVVSSHNSYIAARVANAFMAVSSFGNIIVNTYTAARVKQELAKEGILVCPWFFARGFDMHWRRLLTNRAPYIHWGRPSHARETPAAAFLLHWTFSVLLIFITCSMSPSDAYTILMSIYSYLFAALFPGLVGLAMLYLRLYHGRAWKLKTALHGSTFNPYISTICALLVTVGGFAPVVIQWIPPHVGNGISKPFGNMSWWIVPTVSCSVLGTGLLWWLGTEFLIPRSMAGKKWVVENTRVFNWDYGYPVLEFEHIIWSYQVVREDDEHEDEEKIAA